MTELIQNETKQRLSKLNEAIGQAQADACVITTSVNLYYLVDFIFDGYLYLRAGHSPLLFVKRPVGLEGDNIIYIRKPEQIAESLRQRNIPLPKRLLAETDSLSFSAATRLQAAFGMPEPKNISSEMRRIRSIKSEYELQQIRECAAVHASVYKQIPALYRRGMTDIEFQIEIERLMRQAGSLGIFRSYGENMDIFMGSVLAGNNAQAASPFDFALGGGGISPFMPLGANGTRLTPGTTVMVDMAGNYKPLMDDMTRSFAVEFAPDEAYRAHQVSIGIHEALVADTRAGTSCADLYRIAEELVKENGLEPFFMGTTQQAKFIGHGVGLEINEPPVLAPRSKEVLQKGMAIAIEPKFVLPDIGAVGVENTYLVGEAGLEKITLCDESLVVLRDGSGTASGT